MQHIGWYVALVAGLVGGCAGPLQVGLRQVLDEAASDQIAFHGRYSGERLQVGGTVSVVSIHKQKEVEHELYGPLGGAAVSRVTQRNMPYVYLVPNDNKPGRVLCFFPQGDYQNAGRVHKGMRVVFQGTFQDYVVKGNDRVVVLNSCQIVEGA